MASTIFERTISGTPDKRILMQNSQFARSLIVGSSWNEIRVGIRASQRDSGANITGTPRFAVGLSAGTANIFGDATTDHWVGVLSTAATWTRANLGADFYYGDIVARPAKRVAAVTTTGTQFTGAGVYTMADAPDGNRWCYFVHITKGSPNFSIRLLSWDNVFIDISQATFKAQLETPTPVVSQHTWHTAQTIAVNEAVDGFLNAVNIAWDRSSPEIEISDIGVVKFA